MKRVKAESEMVLPVSSYLSIDNHHLPDHLPIEDG